MKMNDYIYSTADYTNWLNYTNNYDLYDANYTYTSAYEDTNHLPSFINNSHGQNISYVVDANLFKLPWWRQLLWSVLFGGMVIVATGGNLIVIWIVLAHKRMRTVTNYFIVNLSIADAMVSTLNVTFNYIYMLNSHWPFGTLYCKISQFVAILSICASVFTLMAISIDRTSTELTMDVLIQFYLQSTNIIKTHHIDSKSSKRSVENIDAEQLFNQHFDNNASSYEDDYLIKQRDGQKYVCLSKCVLLDEKLSPTLRKCSQKMPVAAKKSATLPTTENIKQFEITTPETTTELSTKEELTTIPNIGLQRAGNQMDTSDITNEFASVELPSTELQFDSPTTAVVSEPTRNSANHLTTSEIINDSSTENPTKMSAAKESSRTTITIKPINKRINNLKGTTPFTTTLSNTELTTVEKDNSLFLNKIETQLTTNYMTIDNSEDTSDCDNSSDGDNTSSNYSCDDIDTLTNDDLADAEQILDSLKFTTEQTKINDASSPENTETLKKSGEQTTECNESLDKSTEQEIDARNLSEGLENENKDSLNDDPETVYTTTECNDSDYNIDEEKVLTTKAKDHSDTEIITELDDNKTTKAEIRNLEIESVESTTECLDSYEETISRSVSSIENSLTTDLNNFKTKETVNLEHTTVAPLSDSTECNDSENDLNENESSIVDIYNPTTTTTITIGPTTGCDDNSNESSNKKNDSPESRNEITIDDYNEIVSTPEYNDRTSENGSTTTKSNELVRNLNIENTTTDTTDDCDDNSNENSPDKKDIPENRNESTIDDNNEIAPTYEYNDSTNEDGSVTEESTELVRNLDIKDTASTTTDDCDDNSTENLYKKNDIPESRNKGTTNYNIENDVTPEYNENGGVTEESKELARNLDIEDTTATTTDDCDDNSNENLSEKKDILESRNESTIDDNNEIAPTYEYNDSTNEDGSVTEESKELVRNVDIKDTASTTTDDCDDNSTENLYKKNDIPESRNKVTTNYNIENDVTPEYNENGGVTEESKELARNLDIDDTTATTTDDCDDNSNENLSEKKDIPESRNESTIDDNNEIAPTYEYNDSTNEDGSVTEESTELVRNLDIKDTASSTTNDCDDNSNENLSEKKDIPESRNESTIDDNNEISPTYEYNDSTNEDGSVTEESTELVRNLDIKDTASSTTNDCDDNSNENSYKKNDIPESRIKSTTNYNIENDVTPEYNENGGVTEESKELARNLDIEDTTATTTDDCDDNSNENLSEKKDIPESRNESTIDDNNEIAPTYEYNDSTNEDGSVTEESTELVRNLDIKDTASSTTNDCDDNSNENSYKKNDIPESRIKSTTNYNIENDVTPEYNENGGVTEESKELARNLDIEDTTATTTDDCDDNSNENLSEKKDIPESRNESTIDDNNEIAPTYEYNDSTNEDGSVTEESTELVRNLDIKDTASTTTDDCDDNSTENLYKKNDIPESRNKGTTNYNIENDITPEYNENGGVTEESKELARNLDIEDMTATTTDDCDDNSNENLSEKKDIPESRNKSTIDNYGEIVTTPEYNDCENKKENVSEESKSNLVKEITTECNNSNDEKITTGDLNDNLNLSTNVNTITPIDKLTRLNPVQPSTKHDTISNDATDCNDNQIDATGNLLVTESVGTENNLTTAESRNMKTNELLNDDLDFTTECNDSANKDQSDSSNASKINEQADSESFEISDTPVNDARSLNINDSIVESTTECESEEIEVPKRKSDEIKTEVRASAASMEMTTECNNSQSSSDKNEDESSENLATLKKARLDKSNEALKYNCDSDLSDCSSNLKNDPIGDLAFNNIIKPLLEFNQGENGINIANDREQSTDCSDISTEIEKSIGDENVELRQIHTFDDPNNDLFRSGKNNLDVKKLDSHDDYDDNKSDNIESPLPDCCSNSVCSLLYPKLSSCNESCGNECQVNKIRQMIQTRQQKYKIYDLLFKLQEFICHIKLEKIHQLRLIKFRKSANDELNYIHHLISTLNFTNEAEIKEQELMKKKLATEKETADNLAENAFSKLSLNNVRELESIIYTLDNSNSSLDIDHIYDLIFKTLKKLYLLESQITSHEISVDDTILEPLTLNEMYQQIISILVRLIKEILKKIDEKKEYKNLRIYLKNLMSEFVSSANDIQRRNKKEDLSNLDKNLDKNIILRRNSNRKRGRRKKQNVAETSKSLSIARNALGIDLHKSHKRARTREFIPSWKKSKFY